MYPDRAGRSQNGTPGASDNYLEFMGQSGKYQYQIWFQGTSENITRIDSMRGYRGGLAEGPTPGTTTSSAVRA